MNLGALSPERANVVAALQNAAQRTGSDFNYLLGTAMRESSLKPQAQSATSSATGLFQFIEQTWLGLVKDHAPARLPRRRTRSHGAPMAAIVPALTRMRSWRCARMPTSPH